MISVDKVLIVDDDATARFLMERVIKKFVTNQQILTATNGEEALVVLGKDCASDICPTLILLDINMPVMDGFEFLKALQSTPLANIPVQIIMLTSSVNPQDVERAKEYPLSGYLQKPLTEEKLQQVLAA